jgi:hypothetical protein
MLRAGTHSSLKAPSGAFSRSEQYKNTCSMWQLLEHFLPLPKWKYVLNVQTSFNSQNKLERLIAALNSIHEEVNVHLLLR